VEHVAGVVQEARLLLSRLRQGTVLLLVLLLLVLRLVLLLLLQLLLLTSRRSTSSTTLVIRPTSIQWTGRETSTP